MPVLLSKPIGGSPPPDTITGTGDVTLPVSALAGMGQVEIVGAGDVTLPVSTVAGTGVIQIDGTGAAEFLVSALAGDGTVSEPLDTALPYKPGRLHVNSCSE